MHRTYASFCGISTSTVIRVFDEYAGVRSFPFPKAMICVDSFHVIQMINNAFDKVRVRIMNTYERNTEEYRLLKKYHWLLKKSADKIEYDEILDLHHYYSIVGARHINQEALISRLLLISPELELAYELKTDYAAINATSNFQNAEYRIDKFLEDMKIYGIPEFYSTRRTMKRWKTEIINSFQKYNGRRISSGPIESMNSRIKKLKRNGNGYKSFERFRTRCLYTLNKGSSIKF